MAKNKRITPATQPVESQGFTSSGSVTTPQSEPSQQTQRWHEASPSVNLPLFTLLVDGESVDTGQYEYYTYSDKLVTDPLRTREVVAALKLGQAPSDYRQFVYAQYCVSSKDLDERALESAYRASLVYRQLSVAKRTKIFKDVQLLLEDHRQAVIDLFILEGHPRKLAEWEFLGMRKGGYEEIIAYYKTHMWEEIGMEGQERNYLVRRPDGVVGVFAPRTAATSSSFIAVAALFAGNALIIKPPYKSPLSTIYVWKEVVHRALMDNGAPAGTINIILGNSGQILDRWLADPRLQDVFYCGGSDNGLEAGKKVYASGKKPILELSGNDRLLVWKDADVDKVTAAILDAFIGSTQVCMVPKLVLIHPDIFEQVAAKVAHAARQLRPGLPSDPQTILAPVAKIREFYEFLQDACAQGATVLCGNRRLNYRGELDDAGHFLDPTVIQIPCERMHSMRCVNEEIFFPLLPLVKVVGESDEAILNKMIEIVNNSAYGMRVSVWVRSPYYLRKFVKSIHRCGQLRINSRHIGFSLYLATHGGVGKSGGPLGQLNYMSLSTTHLQGLSITR